MTFAVQLLNPILNLHLQYFCSTYLKTSEFSITWKIYFCCWQQSARPKLVTHINQLKQCVTTYTNLKMILYVSWGYIWLTFPSNLYSFFANYIIQLSTSDSSTTTHTFLVLFATTEHITKLALNVNNIFLQLRKLSVNISHLNQIKECVDKNTLVEIVEILVSFTQIHLQLYFLNNFSISWYLNCYI